MKRRDFLRFLGEGSVGAAFLAQIFGALRAFIPNVLYEPPKRFKIGKPEDYAEGVTFLGERKLFLFKEGNRFHIISAVCTHLGCTVQWKSEKSEFYCPCHGSKFTKAGENFSGPAPTPLAWHLLSLGPDRHLLVDINRKVKAGYHFTAI